MASIKHNGHSEMLENEKGDEKSIDCVRRVLNHLIISSYFDEKHGITSIYWVFSNHSNASKNVYLRSSHEKCVLCLLSPTICNKCHR